MDAAFVPRHVEHSGTIRVAAPVEEAFAFFTPDGETRWVPGWRPQYYFPIDGTPGTGLTFRTDMRGETTIWLVTRYDPVAGQAEYVRMTPGSRLGTVTIACSPESPHVTSVEVSYRLTAVSPDGNAALEAFDRGAFSKMLRDWERTVGALLSGE